MELQALAEVIDQLCDTDPAAWAGDGDAVVTLHRLSTRLESIVTGAMAAFEASGTWSADGARSATAWINTRCRTHPGHTGRLARRGRALREMPAAAEAFGGGEITGDHVDALVRIRNPRTRGCFERDEEQLVAYAKELKFPEFMRTLAYWEQFADPDGTEAAAERQRSRRDVIVSESIGGMWLGTITLDPVSGTIVHNELDRIERAMFEADWAEATERLGHVPTVADLRRTPADRRADALAEMAVRSASCPDGARRPRPLFSVLVDYPTLHGRLCQLARGTVVTPGSLVPWLEAAEIERAVFTPGGRVEVGHTTRLFTGATRRAIELRDRECTHPYCDEPAERCQVDHILEYRNGGLTTQANGRMLCAFHNRLRNYERPPPDDDTG